MEVYFDNSASTPLSESVLEKMQEVMREVYANPASLSKKGMEAENYIISARKQLASYIGAQPEEIYFTSGGTESDNWAIFGAADGMKRRGKHIITTAIEHPAVMMPVKKLEEQGFSVTYLPVNACGQISMAELEQAVKKDTILVSVIAVNNETGSILPLEEIGALIKRKNPDCLFHVDAVQAFGKQKIQVKRAKIDMLSASAHKLHGPKGVGLFYLRENALVHPFLYGGGHQRGFRSGTENTAGDVGFALAAQEAFTGLSEHTAHVQMIKKMLYDGLLQTISELHVNGGGLEKTSPYVLNVSFLGVKSEILLHALEEKGIYVSAGSACSSHKKQTNSVLKAYGLTDKELESAIRFSFSRYNTITEVQYCIQALQELVPKLRLVHMGKER